MFFFKNKQFLYKMNVKFYDLVGKMGKLFALKIDESFFALCSIYRKGAIASKSLQQKKKIKKTRASGAIFSALRTLIACLIIYLFIQLILFCLEKGIARSTVELEDAGSNPARSWMTTKLKKLLFLRLFLCCKH